jgi:hypothetical protein
MVLYVILVYAHSMETIPSCDSVTPPPPPPPRTHHHATCTHRPPLPFHTARLKPSHSGSVSHFWPKPTPHLVFRKRATPPPPPPRTCHHPTPTHRPALPFHMVHLKPSHVSSVSVSWPKPAPRLAFRECATSPPPPCTRHHATPMHHPALTQRARNRAMAAQFRVFGPNPLPASCFTNT